MTTVERFIEFNSWPTARKTMLLMGIALPAHVLISGIVSYALRYDPGILQTEWLNVLLLAAIGVTALCLGFGWVAEKLGHDGRWTAYLVIVLYGGWVAVFITSMGVWSSLLTAWAPLMVVLVALWYDERIGRLACIFFLAVVALECWLHFGGYLPYAWLVVERNLDDQLSWPFVVAVLVPFFGFFFYAFLLSLLTIATRKLQDTRLRAAHQQLDRSSRLIRRYIPSQVADAILGGQDEAIDKHTRRKLTAFFSDLVGFTDLAEQMEPEEFSRVLNEYFTAMTAIADRYDGTVDELAGDAILILFGAPMATDDKDHALRAVRMAQDMQATVQTLNAKWLSSGIEADLKVRMGINTGVVTIGNFGSEGRTKYTALGKHINLAARIQAQCEPDKVLISHATWLLVNDQIECTSKGEMQFKGIHKPVMTYQLTAEQ